MIVELFLIVSTIIGAAVLLDVFIDWAKDVVRSIYNAIAGILYATRLAASRAVFKIYTKLSDGRYIEKERYVSESEVPAEVRNLSIGVQTRVAEIRV